MLAIVRVRIRLKETTKRGVVSLQTGNMDRVWRRVVRNHEKWSDGNARIVYLTHRSLQEDVSLILDAKDSDSVGKFIFDHVAPMKEVDGIRIIDLYNPRFFKPRKETPKGMKRYTVSITVDPNSLEKVYDYLSNFMPTKRIVPVYLAATFNGFGRDLIFSVLCSGETTAKWFVKNYIDMSEGVLNTKTTYISHSKRLTSSEEWKKILKPLTVKSGDFEIEDIEEFDEDWFGAC